jgi:choline dehydrogenase-like flavoprotein
LLTKVHTNFSLRLHTGGTAGCTIARRLSEADPTTTILLIERGKPADNWVSRIPFLSHALLLGYAQSFSQKTAPAEHLNGRTLDIHGGRALGGSSRNNGLMYFRGVAGEFNEWAEQGREGWSYEEVEPFFKMSQKSLDPQQMDYQGHQGSSRQFNGGDDAYGFAGPWTTKRHSDLLFPPSQK